jgi:PPK2 family polyphosphate:nucleotide phosphotransferase
MVFVDEAQEPFSRYVERYRVPGGSPVTLADYDPQDSGPLKKGEGKRLLEDLAGRLNALQELLFATEQHALLVVLQGMDCSGKDGVIKRVISAMNPQGFAVTSFKAPTPEELAHDFLWRVHRRVPRRGMVGVFNRSHYEDVLVVRVESLVPEPIWRKRYGAIRDFERLLAQGGVQVVKFMLYISPEEQRARLEDRLADPTEHWKFRAGDLATRQKWDAYMSAFEAALEECSTDHAPWYVVPADRKWYRDAVVAQVLVNRLEALQMEWPPLDPEAAELTIP